MTRVLVADAHASTRLAVRNAVGHHVEICGEASTPGEALAGTESLKPDLVLVDADLPGRSSLNLVRDLRRLFTYTKVIVLSAYESPSLAWLFRKAGADGYLLKSDIGRSLADALLDVAAGRAHFMEHVPGAAPPGAASTPSPRAQVLTARENDVLRLLAKGKSNKEVAAALNVSVNTVETHRARIMSKLDLHTINALVFYAIRSRLIDV